MSTDVAIDGGGTVYIFWIHSNAARDWLEERVETPAWARIASSCDALGGIYVEHGYANDLAGALLSEGFAVTLNGLELMLGA